MSGCPKTCTRASESKLAGSTSGADTCAIIVAAGSGERFGDPRGKQFIELCGLPMMCWPLMTLDRCPSVGAIVVVCAENRMDDMVSDVLERLVLAKPVTLVAGGSVRQDSVWSGLRAMPAGFDLVAVQDAARPLTTVEIVEDVLGTIRADATLTGAIAATRCIDTLKLAEDGVIVSTPDRSFYWAAQTPQCFRTKELVEAYVSARREGFVGTDDASLVERMGQRVRCVECPRDNIKVTVPEDLPIAESTLSRRLAEEGCGLV